MEKFTEISLGAYRFFSQMMQVFLIICFVISCFYGCEGKIGQKGHSVSIEYKQKGLLNNKYP